MQKIQKKLKELKADTTNLLEKEVLNDILNEDEPLTYIKDILNGGIMGGSVSNLIYYSDTKEFFIKFIDEIEDFKVDFEESTGIPLEIKHPSYNWLAWFGYEETVRRIAEKIGVDEY